MILAILAFVAFSGLILIFVTLRQVHNAESHSLRLLANFSHRLESTLEDLTGRFARIAMHRKLEEDDENDNIETWIDNIQHLELVGTPLPHTGHTPLFDFKARDGHIYLSYRGPYIPEGQDSPAGPPRRVDAAIDLAEVARQMMPRGVFSSLVVSDSEGRVLFQEGEPELRAVSIRRLLEEARPDSVASGPESASFREEVVERMAELTGMVDVEIARRGYRLLIQPIAVHYRPDPKQPPEAVRLTAYGLVAADRLLAASFTSSPLLVLALFAIFPLGLLAWPLLKLWLILPRQRFTRIDVAALITSSTLGLAFVTLLVFVFHFHLRLESLVDRELETLSTDVSKHLFAELEEIHRQLKITDEQYCKETSSEEESYEERLRTLLTDPETSKIAYPFFDTIFWMDDEGHQVANLPLHRYSSNTNPVADRDYFECALHQQELRLESNGTPFALCLQSILSNTSGKALAVASRRLTVDCAPTSTPKLVGIAMATELLTLTRPALPEHYAFAVVASDGEVQFHSDPTRNLSENVLKACGEDSTLRSVLATRRIANLDVNYLGFDHRARVEPLQGLPWSLVVMRASGDSRRRLLEMAIDAFNPFILQIILLCLIGAFFLMARRPLRLRKYSSWLWPDPKKQSYYSFMVLFTPALLGVFVFLLRRDDPVWLFLFSIFLPVIALLLIFTCIHFFRWVLIRELGSIVLLGAVAVLWTMIFGLDHMDAIVPVLILLSPAVLAKIWSSFRDWSQRGIEEARTGGHPRFLGARKLISRGASKVEKISNLLSLAAFFAGVVWICRAEYSLLVTLIFITSILVAVLWWRLIIFSRKDRYQPIAYIFALSCWLLLVGVMPICGFLDLASTRQMQVVIQEAQQALADADERRASTFPTYPAAVENLRWRDEGKVPRVEIGPSDHPVDTATASYREAIFCSRLTGPDVDHETCANHRTAPGRRIWPKVGRVQQPTSLDAIRNLMTWLLSYRSQAFGEMPSFPTASDLTRFQIFRAHWDVVDGALEGKLPRAWGAESVRLRSFWPAEPSWSKLPISWLILVGGLLTLLGLPVLLAIVIANKVVLISTVQPGGVGKDFSRVLDRIERGKPALLVTAVPDLALRSLDTSATGDEKILSAPLSDMARNLAVHQGIESRAKLQKNGDLFQEILRHVEAMKEGGRAQASPLIITHFWPNLDDDTEVDRQIDVLAWLLERGFRLLIVSRFDPLDLSQPHTLGGTANNAERNAGCVARWTAFLSRFDVYYGHEQQHDEDSYRARLEDRARSTDDLSPSVGRLVEITVEECKSGRRLQEIGESVLGEILDDEGGLVDTMTRPQLISRIGHLARAYYHSVWSGCRKDEKVVLYQLARDGLVNPASFEQVGDLVLKGLVVRDPAMRLMNRSFGRFILDTVTRTEVVEWEEEEGTSAWSVLKWLLPLPLLVLGGFFFATQQAAFSNVVGLAVALGSILPIFLNIFDYFQRISVRPAPPVSGGPLRQAAGGVP